MDSMDLKPMYSSSQISGRCIKCLAEQEMDTCIMGLLSRGGDDKELQQKFEMLLEFLKSPESQKLRDESERYLAEGKKVTVKINTQDGKPKYELDVQ